MVLVTTQMDVRCNPTRLTRNDISSHREGGEEALGLQSGDLRQVHRSVQESHTNPREVLLRHTGSTERNASQSLGTRRSYILVSIMTEQTEP